jgi:hypothetical protein
MDDLITDCITSGVKLAGLQHGREDGSGVFSLEEKGIARILNVKGNRIPRNFHITSILSGKCS